MLGNGFVFFYMVIINEKIFDIIQQGQIFLNKYLQAATLTQIVFPIH